MASLRAANATPAAMLEAPIMPLLPASVDVTGVKLKRFSFSIPSLVTSGVGMRGRFLNWTADAMDPFKFGLESENG